MDIRPTGNISSGSQLFLQDVVSPDISSKAKSGTQVEIVTALQEPEPAPTLSQLIDAVKSLNKAMQDQSQSLEFSIDTDSNRTIVKLIDQNTKEVLRQIPTVETLEIAKAMTQTVGLLLRQKA